MEYCFIELVLYVSRTFSIVELFFISYKPFTDV